MTARRDGAGISITFAAPSSPEPIAFSGARAYRVTFGNPHVVLFVNDPANAGLGALAAAARAAAGEANVNVARVVGNDLILLRVDERGVGETLACGTGACEQRLAERVTVRVSGGDLYVREDPRTFELAGPAEYGFEGTTA